GGQRLEVRLGADPAGTAFEVHSADGGPRAHARGTLLLGSPGPRPAGVDVAAVRGRCPAVQDGASCYRDFSRLGLDYGTSFQVIEELAVGEREALAALRLPADRTADAGDYVFHPSLLDAALQTAGRLASAAHDP
ncbi:hypothetical protein AN220_03965, partial [Streptomyces nanshensis]